MRFGRRLAVALTAWVLALGLVAADPSSRVAQAAPVPDGYYLLAYSGTIIRVSSGGTSIRPITYAEWSAAGFPSPRPAPTDYVKYAWSSSISAVTYFDPASTASWWWDRLDYDSWVRAGRPQPRDVGHVAGSYYYQWGTSAELLVEDPGGVNHALTYAQWQASGFQPFDRRHNEGFVKLSWNPTIVRMSDLALGNGRPIGFAEWRDEGFPSPRVVNRITGDQFYREYSSSTIWYSGPSMTRPISYAEWAAAGFPAPSVINYPSGWTVPSRWRGTDHERIPTTERVVALTFDGGGSAAGVTSILNTLARYDVDATFFVTGAFARSFPSAVAAMVADGHPVGNHSNSHPSFPSLTNVQIRAELDAADQSIRAASGRGSRPLFRFPYGDRTAADITVVNDHGYVPFRWTVDSLGWQGTSGGRSAAFVRDRVLAGAVPGAIMLMHVGAHPTDGSTLDADALPGIIEGLRSAGYRFVTLGSLFP